MKIEICQIGLYCNTSYADDTAVSVVMVILPTAQDAVGLTKVVGQSHVALMTPLSLQTTPVSTATESS